MITEKKQTVLKAHVDKQFLKQLHQLIKIIIPSWTSIESGYLFLVAASLVARSLCDLWLINNGTKIERYLKFIFIIYVYIIHLSGTIIFFI